MAFGFGVLRMPPAAFWAMTLKEMAAAMRAVAPDERTALGKQRLNELMRRYPDA